jgi:phenylalanyl-tRNA synthetase beta subunit
MGQNVDHEVHDNLPINMHWRCSSHEMNPERERGLSLHSEAEHRYLRSVSQRETTIASKATTAPYRSMCDIGTLRSIFVAGRLG